MVSKPEWLGHGLNSLDAVLLRLCRIAESAYFATDRGPDAALSNWNLTNFNSYLWPGAGLVEGVPLPQDWWPYSRHEGALGNSATTFVRVTPEDQIITDVAIVYRQTGLRMELDGRELALRSIDANHLASAARDQLRPAHGLFVTGWFKGGEIALSAGTSYKEKYPVTAFNPSRISPFLDVPKPIRARCIVVHEVGEPLVGPIENRCTTELRVPVTERRPSDLETAELAVLRGLGRKKILADRELDFARTSGSNQRPGLNPKISSTTRRVATSAVIFSVQAPLLAAGVGTSWLVLGYRLPFAIAFAAAVATWSAAARALRAVTARQAANKSPVKPRPAQPRSHQLPISERLALGARRGAIAGVAAVVVGAADRAAAYNLGASSGTSAAVTAACVGTAAGVGFALRRHQKSKSRGP
jgi:hypothetical protein